MDDPGYTERERMRDAADYGRHWNTEEARDDGRPCSMCQRMFTGPGILCRKCRRRYGYE